MSKVLHAEGARSAVALDGVERTVFDYTLPGGTLDLNGKFLRITAVSEAPYVSTNPNLQIAYQFYFGTSVKDFSGHNQGNDAFQSGQTQRSVFSFPIQWEAAVYPIAGGQIPVDPSTSDNRQFVDWPSFQQGGTYGGENENLFATEDITGDIVIKITAQSYDSGTLSGAAVDSGNLIPLQFVVELVEAAAD